jgi:ABC-type multidrug transport system fused ATPase/permease subunit
MDPQAEGAVTPGVDNEATSPDLGGMADQSLLTWDTPVRGSALGRAVKLMPRAFHYLRAYRLKAIGLVVVTAAASLITLAEPWPLAFVVDSVLQDKARPGWVTGLVGNGTALLILFAVVASLLITLIGGGAKVVENYLSTNIDLRMGLDFQSDLIQHVQRLSLAFHDDNRVGAMMYRMNQQASSLGEMVVSLPDFAQSLLTIVGMAYVTYLINPHVAELALVVVPFIYYSTIYYAEKIEPSLLKVRGMEGMNIAIVHEVLTMFRVILAFGREGHQYHRFRRQGEATVDMRVKVTLRQTLFELVVNFFTSLGTASVLGVGAYEVLKQRMSAGELLVVMSYIASVYQPMESLTHSLTGFQQQMISFESSLRILDTPVEVMEKPDARTLGRAAGEIAFDHLTFDYETRPGVLKDVSFHLPAGEALAIVGPTGAGKSTLASLIPRFYDAQDGRVIVDGHDTRDLTLESLRAQFALVLQEPLLFDGKISDNIRFGRLDATTDEVVGAAQAANAHDFIMRLPMQYDTPLGEGGAKISGGERQRICVARAFLRDAPILILDEPTSSIDSRTEGVILDALDRLMVGRTTILIAHRLSTIRSVGQILVLNDGAVVQAGSHDELAAEEGLYRQLWLAQTGQRRNGQRSHSGEDGRSEPLVANLRADGHVSEQGH